MHARRWEQVRPRVPGVLDWLSSRLYNLSDPGPGYEVHADCSPLPLSCFQRPGLQWRGTGRLIMISRGSTHCPPYMPTAWPAGRCTAPSLHGRDVRLLRVCLFWRAGAGA